MCFQVAGSWTCLGSLYPVGLPIVIQNLLTVAEKALKQLLSTLELHLLTAHLG